MRTKKEKTATKNLSITQFTLVLERMINKLMLNEGKIDKLEVVDDIRYFKSYNPKIINYITKETDDINKEKDNLEEIAKIKCNTIGLDWTMNAANARKIVGNTKTLQGNADPCMLYSDEKTIEAEASKMLKAFGKDRYIANLGHGLYPDTDFNKVKYFVDCIKSHKF